MLTLIIIAGLGWVVWWSGWIKPTLHQEAPAPQTTPVATTTPPTAAEINGMSPKSDTSDTAIVQDAAAIDGQMQSLTADTASIDASFNDKPVSQSY